MSDFSAVASNQSAYAAALERAKQIAAKIQPNPAQGGGGGGGVGQLPQVGFKRSLEDDMGPDSKRFSAPDFGNSNSNMSTGSGSGQGNISQAMATAAAVAARIAATAGTTCEEQVRIPDSILNAMTGRSSNDTLTHIQAESGCKVQLSHDQGDRVCTLRGSRESVTKGREVMQQMANRSGGGNVEVVLTINMPPPGPTGYPPYQEIMIPGTKVGLVIGKGGDTIKQLQEKTGAKMVIIQEGPNQEVIKPLRISGDPQKIEHAKQLVLELIAAKDSQTQQTGARNNANSGPGGNNAGGGGGGGGGFNNFGGSGGEQCEVFVPKIAVGVVIGKGGEMIRKIQMECGCKLQFIQGKNDEPGDRRCLIQGSKQQVEDAKRMIDGLIENVMQRNRNGGGGGGGNNNNSSNDGSNSNYGYGYGVNHAQQPAREEITFMVPASKCGIVIGRGGETIKLINQQSGAYCEMDRNAVNPPSEKLFKCKGTSEQVEAARQMISEKINMDLTIISRKPISGLAPNSHGNQQGGGGGGGGGYGQSQMQNDPSSAYQQQQQQQQQWGGYGQQNWGDQAQQMGGMAQNAAVSASQQADYSAQWIEYYKSMGMHREAEMIEQQLKAKQAAGGVQSASNNMQAAAQAAQTQQPQAQAAATAAAGGQQQQDYSAQWAEYYRSIGKMEEAEAIEKQMKQGGQAAAATTGNSSNPMSAGQGGNSGAPVANPGNPGMGNAAMTPSQYAQYSQYYAAAAAVGGYPQPGGYGAPSGYGAPGGYPPGANNGQPQPPKGKPDKN